MKKEIPHQMLISKTKELIDKNIVDTRKTFEQIREQLNNALEMTASPIQGFDQNIEHLRNLHQALTESLLLLPKSSSHKSENILTTDDKVISCILTLKCIQWIAGEAEIIKIFNECQNLLKSIEWIDKTPIWNIISWESNRLGVCLFSNGLSQYSDDKKEIAKLKLSLNDSQKKSQELNRLLDNSKIVIAMLIIIIVIFVLLKYAW